MSKGGGGTPSRSDQKRFLPAAKTPPTSIAPPAVSKMAPVELPTTIPFPRAQGAAEPPPAPAPVVKPYKPPVHMLTNADRERLFGKFDFTPKPSEGNPERIVVDPKWVAENIVSVKISAELVGLPADGVPFHRLVAPHFEALIQAWAEEGLLSRIFSWNGSYVPRFRRGQAAQGVLSAHSWGSAFDINARWNGFKKEPAALGAEGSVLELIPTAKRLGWIWGGDFSSPDGMHFEAGEKLFSET